MRAWRRIGRVLLITIVSGLGVMAALSIAAYVSLPKGCHTCIDEPLARRWSRAEIVELLDGLELPTWRERRPTLARLATVNRRDHPWVAELLAERFEAACKEPQSLADGFADAILWFGGPAAGATVRSLATKAWAERWPRLEPCV